MHLMQAQMTEIRSRSIDFDPYRGLSHEAWNNNPNYEKLSPYVGHIYQIRFDAWTFAKSDIWASLMQTIFFELDRQISLEQQIAEELTKKDPSKSKAQILCESGQSWAVLYESDKEERRWLLKNVIADEQRLERLEAQTTKGKLWDFIAKAQSEDEQKLRHTEDLLKQARKDYQTKLKKVREETSQQFTAILKIQNNERIQWLDTLFGTSFILLKQKIGPKLFNELNNKILQELYGTANAIEAPLSLAEAIKTPPDIFDDWAKIEAIEDSNDAASETVQMPPRMSLDNPEECGLWGKLYIQIKELEDAKQKFEGIQKQDVKKMTRL